MKARFISILLLSLTLIPSLASGQVNEQDSLALVDLYNSTDGPNWHSNNYWLTKVVASWENVHVSGSRVVEINIPTYNLSGSIPSSIGNLTALTGLKIRGNNKLTGEIPASVGNLTEVEHLYLSDNQLTGEIPSSIENLKALEQLSLDFNKLTGNIPTIIGNLPALIFLDFSYNNLTGEIPLSIVNLTILKWLLLHNNNLTGEILSSIGNLTALTSLRLDNNKLTGEIPASIGNLTELTALKLGNNKLTGEIPSTIGNLTKLSSWLDLSGNNLSGEIPSSIGNLKTLRNLFLNNNILSGEIPSSIGNLTVLSRLSLNHNNLSGDIPSSIANLPALTYLELQNNNFDFDDLEPIAAQNINKFLYAPQDTIILNKEKFNETFELSMDAGGKQTTYQWYYDNAKIVGSTANKYVIPPGMEVQKYYCEAKNSLLPDLTLIGKLAEDDSKDCWEVGMLSFCLNSGTWENIENSSKIKSTDIVSINDFLFFNGTMIIDTLKLEASVNGEFYVDNIPIPGGGTGKYALLEGEQNLKLMGNEGQIMDFLNSGLLKTATLFGAKLKIENLKFFNRQDTVGMTVGCSAHIPWVSESCGTPGIYTPGTDLKLKNLEITNKGILAAGFEVDNLGLFSKDHCLKRIAYAYDLKKDIVIAGGDIALPFIKVELGGGFKLKKGEIDSVAWSAEYLPGDKDKLKAIPVGFYTLGVKGFSGSISGLNQPGEFNPLNLSYELAGTFSDVTSENWYRLKGTGYTLWPKKFKIKGEGQLLKPMEGIPYQLKGDTEMSYNVSENWIYMGFRGLCVPITMDEKLWLIDGVGNINMHMHKETPPTFTGNIEGLLTLPKLQSNWFFGWLSTIVDLPVTLHTNNKFSDKHLTYIYGKTLLKTPKHSFSIKYIFDVEKNWYQSGYFKLLDYEYSTKSAFVDNKSAHVANNSNQIFNVPENNSFGVIEIKSKNTVPKSSLKSPLGKNYTESNEEDNVLYTESENRNESYWTLIEPTPGEWTISLENPSQSDSIITHFQLKDQEFKFSMNQTSNIVSVNWDVLQVNSGQTVNIMLDHDNANFDGFKIMDVDATIGSASFTLDENTPGCSYYLYAQLLDENCFSESYAEDIIENPLATLAPPENLSSEYNSETGEFDFKWTENPTSEIAGYILSVTDEFGNDSVYAILNSNQTNISLFIEDFETKSAKIEAYNQDWKIGCPTTSLKLTTSIDGNLQIEEPDNKLNVFPNPTTGNLTMRYYVSEESNCEIRIFDIEGRQIAQPLAEYKLEGFHQLNFNYQDVPNGLYIIKFISNYQTFTVKSILSK